MSHLNTHTHKCEERKKKRCVFASCWRYRLTSYSSVLQTSSYTRHSFDSVQKLVLVLGLQRSGGGKKSFTVRVGNMDLEFCCDIVALLR